MNRPLFVFALIFCFALISRVFYLWYPNTYYFDEVYHAFTAEAYAKNDPRAYFWHEAPKGFAYEWLHPPAAKLIQAASIKLFGNLPFFWRLPSVIFGLGTLVLLYKFGQTVFRSEKTGLFAGILWALDGLSFSASRITMNDIFLTFWAVLASFLFLNSDNLLFVGIVLGLAIATKWSGVFVAAAISLMWFLKNRKSLNLKKLAAFFFFFFITPLLIYIASYGQYFLQGKSLADLKNLHEQIWLYQTNLQATHPYSSKAWQWPFLVRPVYLYTNQENNNVSNIYMMGNPIIFWIGLALIILGLVKIKKEEKKIKRAFGAILITYILMFLPWLFSPRIMFLYHYLPALPFLFLINGWVLSKLWQTDKKIVLGYLVLCFSAFVFFYPHWTGITIPKNIDNFYYWFSTWR